MASGKGGSSCPSPALTLWLQVDHVSFHESLLPTKQEGPTCFSGAAWKVTWSLQESSPSNVWYESYCMISRYKWARHSPSRVKPPLPPAPCAEYMHTALWSEECKWPRILWLFKRFMKCLNREKRKSHRNVLSWRFQGEEHEFWCHPNQSWMSALPT